MDELKHHGVHGQHWGIRRWQNYDGSLTPAGERRFRKVERSKSLQKESKQFAIKETTKELKTTTRKLKKATKRQDEIGREMFQKHQDVLNQRLSDIKSDTIKAGRDYVMACSSVKVPIVYVTTRPKAKLVTVRKKNYLIMKKPLDS